MRKYILIFVTIALLQSTIYSQKNDDCPCTPLTEKIYDRYYIIARLTNMFKLVTHLDTTHKKQLIQSLSYIDTAQFSTIEIIDCINLIKKQKQLDALWVLWKHIDSYHNITDEEYIREFMHLLALVMTSIKHQMEPNSKIAPYTTDYTCPIIPMNIEQSPNQHLMYNIIFRFFLLHRLARAIKHLKYFQKNKPSVFNASICPSQELITDPTAKQCYTLILEHKTIEPLFDLWDRLESFDAITNFNHSKNFIIIILLIYKTILLNNTSHTTAANINLNMENIRDKTTQELLEIIDEYVIRASDVNSLQSTPTLASLFKDGLRPFTAIGNWISKILS